MGKIVLLIVLSAFNIQYARGQEGDVIRLDIKDVIETRDTILITPGLDHPASPDTKAAFRTQMIDHGYASICNIETQNYYAKDSTALNGMYCIDLGDGSYRIGNYVDGYREGEHRIYYSNGSSYYCYYNSYGAPWWEGGYDKEERADGRWIEYSHRTSWLNNHCTVSYYTHGRHSMPDTLYSCVPIRDINPGVEVVAVIYYNKRDKAKTIVYYKDGKPHRRMPYRGKIKRYRGWYPKYME
jgi:antitoxin component YwqK of YwqJK toxin-antitoxin module